VIVRTLGDIRGKSLLDLACGDGFYTRRFRGECAANPVRGIDLSPKQIARDEAIERRESLGIEYQVGDVTSLNVERPFDIVTQFICCIISRFDLDKHDPSDSKTKFGYYLEVARGRGGPLQIVLRDHQRRSVDTHAPGSGRHHRVHEAVAVTQADACQRRPSATNRSPTRRWYE
jgi:SAM-dependent methyltransferase